MAYNPKVTWHKSPSLNVTGYLVAWTLNGTPVGTGTVAQANNLDSAGYSAQFGTLNPTVTLKANDVVGVTVQTVDAVNSLSSSVVVSAPTTLTIPATAPEPPVNVVLSLS